MPKSSISFDLNSASGGSNETVNFVEGGAALEARGTK